MLFCMGTELGVSFYVKNTDSVILRKGPQENILTQKD
jgi:hypothetical protein